MARGYAAGPGGCSSRCSAPIAPTVIISVERAAATLERGGTWGYEGMTVQMVPPSSLSPSAKSQSGAASAPAIVALLAIAESDVSCYPVGAFTTITVHTTADAIQCVERIRPPILAVDWDLPAIDGSAVCRAAAQFAAAIMLATTGSVERVPAAIKAGCQSVLLKPFTRNLAAARLGRLYRDISVSMSPAVRAAVEHGTNRKWPHTSCPRCGAAGATSFDHASYRRSWYTCLDCEHVWLGARQE